MTSLVSRHCSLWYAFAPSICVQFFFHFYELSVEVILRIPYKKKPKKRRIPVFHVTHPNTDGCGEILPTIGEGLDALQTFFCGEKSGLVPDFPSVPFLSSLRHIR